MYEIHSSKYFLFTGVLLALLGTVNFVYGIYNPIDSDYVDPLLDRGKYDEVLLYLDDLAVDHPNNTDVFFTYGYVLMEQKRYSEAIAYYDKVLQEDHVSVNTLYNKALTLEMMGKYDQSLVYYNKVLDLDPTDIDAGLNKSEILYILGDYEGASLIFEELLKRLDMDLQSNPDDIVSLYNKGWVLGMMERYDDSLTIFDRILDLDPEDTDALLNKGEVFYSMKDYEKALLVFERLLEIDPKNMDATFYVNQINKAKETSVDFGYVNPLIERGQYDQVLSYLDELSLDNPDDKGVLFTYGHIMDILGHYSDALVYYDKVLQKDPADISTLYNKALTLEMMGEYDEALANYQRVLDLDPEDGKTMSAIRQINEIKQNPVDYNYIDPLIEQKEYDRVLSYLDELSVEHPDDVDVLFTYGYVLGEAGRYSDSLTFYDRLLEDDPNNIDTLYNKGWTLDMMGTNTEAIKNYNMVLRLDPQDLDALLNKGDLLYRMEKYDEATTVFEELLEIDPGNQDAEFYISEINKTENPPNYNLNLAIILIAIVGGIGGSFAIRLRHRWKDNRSISDQATGLSPFSERGKEINENKNSGLLDEKNKTYILNFGKDWGFSTDNKIENEKGKVLGVYHANNDDEFGPKEVHDEKGKLLFTIDKKFSYTSFKEPHQIKMPDGSHIGDVRRGKKWGYGKDMWVETEEGKSLYSRVPNDTESTAITDHNGNRIAHMSLESEEFFEFLKGHPRSWVLHIEKEYNRVFLLALFFTMIHQKYSTNLGGGG